MKITLPKGTKVESVQLENSTLSYDMVFDLTDSQAEELLKQLLPEEYLMVSKEEYNKMFPNMDKDPHIEEYHKLWDKLFPARNGVFLKGDSPRFLSKRKELEDFISSYASLKVSEAKESVLLELKETVLRIGKDKGKDTILWDAPQIVKVIDSILLTIKGDETKI